MTRPADFDAYWEAIDAELAAIDPAPALTETPLRSTERSTSYDLKLTSIGPYRIFAFLSVPNGEGPFPALLHSPRYGSVNNPPHWDDRQRYVVLTVMHRGQRLADTPFAADYPGLLTLGIESPDTWIYRGILADIMRGAEFLLSHPSVDPARVAIAGDDLGLIAAARRPGFATVNLTAPFLYRILEARLRTDAYPIEELNDYLAMYPDAADAVANTLSYFDPVAHAPSFQGTAILSEQDPGALNGPEWLEPLRSALGGPVIPYRLSHEGGTDHDALDAVLAKQLRVSPLPRLWPAAMKTIR
ncbi:MAG: acetylxylan esterase [Thermomicrobiales bacterium]|nr:acetylxylan esterase [Thermomicrobiales bacterium]